MSIYECHLTFEPVFDERLTKLEQACKNYKFRVANLVMIKDRKATEERSNRDTFCTGHAPSYEEMYSRMDSLHKEVEALGIKVWRRKIEHIVLDERFNK